MRDHNAVTTQSNHKSSIAKSNRWVWRGYERTQENTRLGMRPDTTVHNWPAKNRKHSPHSRWMVIGSHNWTKEANYRRRMQDARSIRRVSGGLHCKTAGESYGARFALESMETLHWRSLTTDCERLSLEQYGPSLKQHGKTITESMGKFSRWEPIPGKTWQDSGIDFDTLSNHTLEVLNKLIEQSKTVQVDNLSTG